jgi:hypothetical protein
MPEIEIGRMPQGPGAPKVGRNDPCPCGSGKKFKRCHVDGPPINLGVLPPFVLASLRSQVPRSTKSLWEYEDRFGQVGRVRSKKTGDDRLVQVGEKVHKGPWKTMTDFLADYARASFTVEWAAGELKKQPEQQHPVIRIHSEFQGFLRREQRRQRHVSGVFGARPNGSAAHFLNLAYDLYVLDNHRLLQRRLLARLRRARSYQGARYELFVAATCIRAGLSLELEDETDASRRHPEFVAVHTTGVRIAVEAKSRHRPGILGESGDRKKTLLASRADVIPLLNDALDKRPGLPFLIFVDVNLPASADGTKWARAFQAEVHKLPSERLSIANAVVLTNTPHHFASPTEFDPPKEMAIIGLPDPIFPLPLFIFEGLKGSLEKYGNIPQRFDFSV